MAESRHYKTIKEERAFCERLQAMRDEGATLREIGDRVGLRAGRIHQLLRIGRTFSKGGGDDGGALGVHGTGLQHRVLPDGRRALPEMRRGWAAGVLGDQAASSSGGRV